MLRWVKKSVILTLRQTVVQNTHVRKLKVFSSDSGEVVVGVDAAKKNAKEGGGEEPPLLLWKIKTSIYPTLRQTVVQKYARAKVKSSRLKSRGKS